jgi:hypothetical protein
VTEHRFVEDAEEPSAFLTTRSNEWRGSGAIRAKRTEARELLAPVCGWFTEGFDTLDPKEAIALLDEVVKAEAIT